MVQSISSTLTVLAVIIAFGNARFVGAEESVKGGKEKVSPFRTHLNSFPTVAPNAVSVEMFLYPKKSERRGLRLSPNGMLLTTSYRLQDVKPISLGGPGWRL